MEFLSSILSFFLKTSDVKPLRAIDLADQINVTWIASLDQLQSAPDAEAQSIVQQHVDTVASLGMAGSLQGVWVQTEQEILASHQGETPLSAASLSKIATTLVALDTLGVDYQFQTLVSATGPVENGVLQGDLVVQGSGDPFFVWEEAIALANALQERGIQRVAGKLVVTDNFVMNFEKDPAIAATLLKQGMNASLWNAEAATQYATLPLNTPRPQLVIDGNVQVVSKADAANQSTIPLVRHRSLPLVDLLRAMNIYSNNVMADLMADQVGGAAVVSQKAAAITRLPASEIHLINGSGLGVENQLSPRAIGAMLTAIQRIAKQHQLTIADLFPVKGRDRGTLGSRNLPLGAALKTGTLNEVSSLAGVFPTRDRGLVWFSIINVGTADLKALHNQQDILLQRLEQHWGAAPSVPSDLQGSDRATQPISQLGAAVRNEPL